MDLRDYIYYRTRWGVTGSADYKLREGSDISLRGLFSTFRNWGNKWVYTLNDGDVPAIQPGLAAPEYGGGQPSPARKAHLQCLHYQSGAVRSARSRSLSGSGSAKY